MVTFSKKQICRELIYSPNPKLLLVLAVLLTFSAIPEAHASINFTPIPDDPNGIGATSATGISGNLIVGNFSGGSPASQGFLYNGTNFVTLNDPLADPSGTGIRSISGNIIVGGYNVTTNSPAGVTTSPRGFQFDGTTWTTITPPSAGSTGSTSANGISGTKIVGDYFDTDGHFHGYVYNGSAYTTLDAPGGAGGTMAFGIDGDNIVGFYRDSLGLDHGFLLVGTTWTPLDDPFGAQGTYVNGISGNNLVGYYVDSAGADHGFLYNGGVWTTLDYPTPGTIQTIASGISGNEIVGWARITSQNSTTTQSFTILIAPEPGSLIFLFGGMPLLMHRFRRAL